MRNPSIKIELSALPWHVTCSGSHAGSLLKIYPSSFLHFLLLHLILFYLLFVFFSFFDVDVCDGAICVVIQRKNTASKSTACLSRITRADMGGVGGGDHRLKNERKRTETRTFILGGGGL